MGARRLRCSLCSGLVPVNSENLFVAAAITKAQGYSPHRYSAEVLAHQALCLSAAVAASYEFAPGSLHFDIPHDVPLDRPASTMENHAAWWSARCAVYDLLIGNGLCALEEMIESYRLWLDECNESVRGTVLAAAGMARTWQAVRDNPKRLQVLATVLMSGTYEKAPPPAARASVESVYQGQLQQFASSWNELRRDIGRPHLQRLSSFLEDQLLGPPGTLADGLLERKCTDARTDELIISPASASDILHNGVWWPPSRESDWS